MTHDNGIEIVHPSELNALLRYRLWRGSVGRRIRLSSRFSHPDKSRWESEINRYYFACGCSTSAKGLILMLFAGIALSGTLVILGNAGPASAASILVLAPLIGALAGKVIGLYTARRRLRRTVADVQASWRPTQGGGSEVVHCG